MKVALVLWLASAWVSTNAGPVSDFDARRIVTQSIPTGSVVTSIQPATPSGQFLSSISDTTQPIRLDAVVREITGSGAEVVSANTVEPSAADFGLITSAIPSITTLNVNRQGNLISAEDDHFSSGELDFDGFDDNDGFRIINSGNSFISQGVGGSVPLSAFVSSTDVSGLGGIGGSVGGGAFGHGGAPAAVGTPLPNFGGAAGFGGSDFGAGGGFGGSDFGAGGGFGGSDFGAGGGFGGADVSFGGASGSVGVPLTAVPLTAVPSTAGPHGGGGVTFASVGGGLGGAGVTLGGVGGDFGGAGVPLDLSGHGGAGVTLGGVDGGLGGGSVGLGGVGGGFGGAGAQLGSAHTGLGGGSVSFGGVGGDFGGVGLPLDASGGLSGAGVSFGNVGGTGLPLGGTGGVLGGGLITSGPAIVSGGSAVTHGGAEIIQADFQQIGGEGQVLGGFSGVLGDSSIGFGLGGPQTLVTHEPVVTSIAAPTSGYLPPSTTFLSSSALPAADYLPPTTFISSPAAPAVNDIFSQDTFISPPTEAILSSPAPTVVPAKSVVTAPITTKISAVTSGVNNLLPTKSIDTPTSTVISAPKAPLLPQLPIKSFSTNGLGALLGSLSTKSITPGQTLGSVLRGLDGQDGIVVVDINSQDIAGTRVSTDDDDLDNFRLDIDSLEDDTASLSIGGGTVTSDAGVSIDTVGISLGDTDTKSVSSLDTTTTAVDTDLFGSAKKALGPKFLFQTPLVDILSTKGRWLGTLIGGLVDLGDAVAKNFNKEKLF
ncbi:PE-PGRS family protein PE_PGRS3-like [Macrobrachium rosenbergii]|uniref:PE-PGRS family protein PE_PGRS3-like n=1 Tax=Macrobrachium rosenbergii TaxID=79674 RepID=UPI0034D50C70